MYTILTKALQIQQTLGTRRAAGFLRNKGISLPAALFFLCFRRPIC